MIRNYVYLNNKFLPEEEAKIPIFSGTVLYGEGLFETMRFVNGKVFSLEEHLNRLKKGAKVLGLKVPGEIKNSKQIIQQLVKLNRLPDAYLRLMLIADEKKGTSLVFFCRDIKNYLKKKIIWTCVIVQNIRQNEYSPLSRIKSLNYLPMLLARREAESKGADEGILLNTKGEVCEGSRANIFIVTEDARPDGVGGILCTPPIESGCLPGITRSAVIELAKGLELEVREKRIKIEELKRAKEIFLTNSLIGVMPARFARSDSSEMRRAARRVTRIDRQIIGNGHPGPWTMKIRQTYNSSKK